jgi:hypothetical protein
MALVPRYTRQPGKLCDLAVVDDVNTSGPVGKRLAPVGRGRRPPHPALRLEDSLELGPGASVVQGLRRQCRAGPRRCSSSKFNKRAGKLVRACPLRYGQHVVRLQGRTDAASNRLPTGLAFLKLASIRLVTRSLWLDRGV